MLTKENNGMVAGNQNDVVKHLVYNRKAILLVFTSVSNYCSPLQLTAIPAWKLQFHDQSTESTEKHRYKRISICQADQDQHVL